MGNIVKVEVKVEVPQSTESEEMSQPDRKDKSVEGKKKLTEEEVKKKEIFKKFNKAIDQIKKITDLQTKNGSWNQNLLQSLCVFLETYSSVEDMFLLQYDLIQNYKREAGQSLSKSKSTRVICKVIMKGLKMGYINKEGNTDTHQFNVISQSLRTLVNYSDCTPEVTYDIAREPGFLETMKEILTKILPAHKQEEAKVEDEEVMKWCLTIYYNTSNVNHNIPRLRNLDIVPVMKSFLDAKLEIYHLTALSTLANIINEKESTEIPQGKDDVIASLLQKLRLALEDPHHRHSTWSAQKCARTVCRLARNDANKTLLVEMGCLPHLVELAKSGNVEEKREAVGTIQILSLKKENRIKIVDDTKLKIVDVLKNIKANSSDKEVRKAVDLTFRNLREELQKKNNSKDIASNSAPADNQSEKISGRLVPAGKGHIMISYNRSHQEKLIKIRDILKEHGYDVWMDIDNMTGSTAEAMAKAVEKAHVILICMSQKYKDSGHCKAEAEYAFSLKKKIIPLMMENGYKPDGWLGFLIGVISVIDFSGEDTFEKKIQDLKNEIANLYRNKDVSLSQRLFLVE